MLSSCRKDEIFEPTVSEPDVPAPENVDERLINGSVYDDSFNPVANIVVALYDDKVLVEEAQTTEDGAFYFIVDDLNDYLLYINSSEYQTVLTNANASLNDNEVLINLIPNEGIDTGWNINSYDWVSIQGVIKNVDGSATSNSIIKFVDVSGIFSNYATTDGDGFFNSTIPANIIILPYFDQQCSFPIEYDYILTDRDIITDDIIIYDINTPTYIQGAVTDCNGNPVASGEITFYSNSNFFGVPLQEDKLGTTLLDDGGFEIYIDNTCSQILYYEAIDNNTNDLVFGEIEVRDSIDLNLEICDLMYEGGLVSLNINNDEYTLESHFAFQYHNRIDIFGSDQENNLYVDFKSTMSEGTFDVRRISIQVNDKYYYDYERDLQIVISEYPSVNQGSLKGSIQGDIYDESFNKVPFDLQFDLPLSK